MEYKVNIIMILFLITVPPILIGQESDGSDYFNKTHEISISGFDIFNNKKTTIYYSPWWYGSSSSYMYYPITYSIIEDNRLYGLAYKYHISKHAIRVGVYFNNSHENENKLNNDFPENQDITKYSLSRYRFSLGYELNKKFYRTQFFFGIDFYYDFREDINDYETYHKVRYYPDPNNNNEYYDIKVNYQNKDKDNKKVFGVNPLIGVKYFITPHLSLSTEARFIIESVRSEKSVWSYNDHPAYGNEESSSLSMKGNNIQLAPVGSISINIHF